MNNTMEVNLLENERIDDLQFKGLRIIQNSKGFCFGIDAVLLANFTRVKKNAKLVDLGTGTGIIPILLAGKSSASKIIGIEIQDEVAEMASRSVKLNQLEDRVEILNMDMKDAVGVLGKGQMDLVVSNPPYMHSNGLINENDKKAISRHGLKCDIEDVIRVASDLVKPNGKFFMVNRPNRLVDMLAIARNYKLEAKQIRFVHSRVASAPKMVLIEYVKSAKPEIRVLSPLYVYNEDGTYTDEVKTIYSNQSVDI